MGWTFPWYSSFGSDFNYDFHVTADETVAPVEYNFQDKVALARGRENYQLQGELPGMSIFLRRGDRVFHAYSTYARGLDSVVSTYNWLDLTPFGRQEEGEDSPPGWPQTPMSWLRLHDSYEEVIKQQAPCCRTNS